MSRIKIKDLPIDQKVSELDLKRIKGGLQLKARTELFKRIEQWNQVLAVYSSSAGTRCQHGALPGMCNVSGCPNKA